MADRRDDRGARWRKQEEPGAGETSADRSDLGINPKHGKLLDLQRRAGNAAVEWGVQRWGGKDDDAILDQTGSAQAPEANGDEKDGDEKVAPQTGVTWGNDLPGFDGVIKTVDTKYTMFSPDGTPLRATANVKMSEASGNVTKSKSASGANKSDGPSSSQPAGPGFGKDEQVEDPKEKWRR